MKSYDKTNYIPKIAITSEIACGILCIFGVILSLLYYARDGYFHWSRRLLYFTAQSNVWLGLFFIFLFFRRLTFAIHNESVYFLIKYVFTVSITMTGIVFCFLLAPLAPKSYNVWSLSGVITHVFTPILAILSLLFSPKPCKIEAKHCFIALLPPLLYFSTVITMSFFNFDFGRGDNFVYFFLNFNSPSLAFAVDFTSSPPLIGSTYWLIVLFFAFLSLAFLLKKLCNNRIFKI